MKKILLSVLCCMLAVIGMQAQTTVTGVAADFYGSATVNIETDYVVDSNITFAFAKNGGSTAPAFNKAGDIRTYAKNTITATCAAGNISKIVFTISAQGKKRLTDLTADNGTVTIDTENRETIVWEGNAATIVFTVGEKAVYGTEGSGKAGQIDFTKVEVTYAAAATGATLEAPTASVESGTLYNATNIELSAAAGEIHYTIDGTEPTAESPVYNGAISVSEFGATTTIKAIAIDGEEYSDVATFAYILKVAAPTFSSESGVYEGLGYAYSTPILRIETATTTAKVNYTWTNYGWEEEGEVENKNSYYNYANLTVKGTTSIVAKAFVIADSDTIWSESVTKYYTISPIKPYIEATSIASGEYAIVVNDTIADHFYENPNNFYGYLYDKTVATTIRTNAQGEERKSFDTNEFYGYTFTETATAGEYTIQDAYGRYLYMTGTYNSFNITKNGENDITSIGDGAIWTISIDQDNVATITNKSNGKIFAYSTKYHSFGAYSSLTAEHIKPTLFELASLPTLEFTPASESTISKFNNFIVSCAYGIENNEDDELYIYYNWNTMLEYDYSENFFNYGEQIDENSVSFEPMNEERGNKNYTVHIPAGIFTLDPGGFFECTNSNMTVYFTVEDNSILEITYSNPNDEATVNRISDLFFEFSQDVTINITEAVITDENGNEYIFTLSEYDAWGDPVTGNALALTTETPITEPGVYTFVLKEEYLSTTSGATLGFDKTYTYAITEPFKITEITPADGSTVESLSEIILNFNNQAYPMAEQFMVINEMGEGAFFTVDWEYYEENSIRLITETPITTAGNYTLFVEGYSFYCYTPSWDMEFTDYCEFYFTVSGTSEDLSGDLNNDGSVDVADITDLVAMILDGSMATAAGDLNNDGSIDVADITELVAIILGTEPAAAPKRAATRSTGATSTFSVDGEDATLYFNVTNPSYEFTGVQFDIYLPEGIEVVNDGEYFDVFKGSRAKRSHVDPSCAIQPDGALRVLLYSSKNDSFTGTEGDIAYADIIATTAADGVYEFEVKNIVLSSPDKNTAKEVLDNFKGSITIANGTTSIDFIAAEGENSNAAIYDLFGRKVTETVKGEIYIQNGSKFIAK